MNFPFFLHIMNKLTTTTWVYSTCSTEKDISIGSIRNTSSLCKTTELIPSQWNFQDWLVEWLSCMATAFEGNKDTQSKVRTKTIICVWTKSTACLLQYGNGGSRQYGSNSQEGRSDIHADATFYNCYLWHLKNFRTQFRWNPIFSYCSDTIHHSCKGFWSFGMLHHAAGVTDPANTA